MKKQEVDIEPLGDGVAIHLPFRQLGSAKRIGWIPLGFGVFVSLFMLGWIGTPVFWGIDALRQGQAFGWIPIAFGCLGFIGLYHAFKIVALGISILKNRTRCTVTVSDSQIVNRENFGWFSHKYKFKRADVEQLFVVPISSVRVADDSQADAATTSSLLEFLFGDQHHQQFTITPQKRGGKLIAAAYPQDLLDDVANTIADELNRHQSASVTIVREPISDQSRTSSSTVTVSSLSEQDVDQALEQEAVSLPPESTIEVVEDDGSLVFKIPQKSIGKGSGGLFAFSVVWNVFLLVFTYGAVVGQLNGADWTAIPILGLFWAVGIGMLVGAIYMARQRAMIGVKDGLLFIERSTIFGTKWSEFSAEEIESIEMAHANMEVNGRPVMNLSITPCEGKAVKMFSHLENQELRWLAQQLQESLGVASKKKRLAVGNFDSADPLVGLESSDIRTRQEGNQMLIDIPPKQFQGSMVLQMIGGAFTLVPLPVSVGAMFIFGAGFEMLLVAVFLTVMGVVMLGIHRYATTRHARIAVSGESIEARIRGFMSNRKLILNQPEVLSVGVADSGMKVNNETMYCLRIKGTGGRSLSLMTGRKQKEIAHVGRLIHQQLKIEKPVGS